MAKWFTMPDGVDSISVRQLEFHPKVVHGGVRYFSVPDHMSDELLTLNIRTGTEPDGRPVFARFVEVARPEGMEDEPDPIVESGDTVALSGQIMTLQVQMEGLRAQIAEITVERDNLRLQVKELEATQAPDDEEETNSGKKKTRGTNRILGAGPHLTDTPAAEGLLEQLSGMTLGKD